VSGARAEIAEGADDFLAGTIGGEDALDEEIVEIGFAFVDPRGFANIPVA
jgi:hypothetical protein